MRMAVAPVMPVWKTLLPSIEMFIETVWLALRSLIKSIIRPAQPTLGSLVLCALADKTAYGDLPAAAFAEQAALVGRIEQLLRGFVSYEKVNYLMLMMVDPHVHFHVLPRYKGSRTFEGHEFLDPGWPGLPDFSKNQVASATLIEAIKLEWQSLS